MIKTVLFDLGSTLIYFDAPMPQALDQAYQAMFVSLAANGYTLDKDQFMADFRRRIEDYYSQRETEFIEYTTGYILRIILNDYGYPKMPPQHLRDALDAMYAVTQSHWNLEADAVETLEELLRRGYRLGMISNAGDSGDVDALLDKCDLRKYFEKIWISAAVGYRKPHPKIFNLAVDYFQASPQEMAMVGDTLGADILGANQAGIHSVWITCRANTPANRDHLDTIRPEATIATLAELPALLARW